MLIAGKTLSATLAGAALLATVGIAPTPSYAGDGGAIALGAIGGLAAGAMLGSALSGPRYYAPPPPPPRRVYSYRSYYPVVDECTTHRVWGPYGWRWVEDC